MTSASGMVMTVIAPHVAFGTALPTFASTEGGGWQWPTS